MKKSMILPFLIISFSFLCTNPYVPFQGGGIGGGGVVISQFYIRPSEIYTGGTAYLIVVLENTGNYNVNNANFLIYGFDPSDWNINNKNNKLIVKSESFNLRGKNFALNIPGGETKFVFVLKNKMKLPANQELPYIFYGRLCYNYETTAYGKVKIVNENELVRENINPKTTTIPLNTGNAPIAVYVKGPQPLVENAGKLSFVIKIKNVGNGFVGSGCKNSDNNYNVVKVTVKLGDKTVVSSKEVYLRKGEDAEFPITVDLSGESIPKGTVGIRVDVSYSYYEDAKATVIVKSLE